ncbi:unnamed protein product [Closterium sp. NIES-64]|nr:unnamed protein product [Closterium sp. NIES-64]
MLAGALASSLAGALAGELAGSLVRPLAGALAGWRASGLARRLAGALAPWLAGALAGRRAGGLARWLAGALAGWRAGWLAGALAKGGEGRGAPAGAAAGERVGVVQLASRVRVLTPPYPHSSRILHSPVLSPYLAAGGSVGERGGVVPLASREFQEPFLAVVIDPTRTVSAGKVEIGAFRTYPKGYKPPDEPPSEYQTIPLSKIEEFGMHCKQEETPLSRSTRDSTRITVEQLHGLMSQVSEGDGMLALTCNKGSKPAPAGYVKAESPKRQVTAEMQAKAKKIAKEAFDKAKKEAKDPENQKKAAMAAAEQIGMMALNALVPGSAHVIDAAEKAKFFKEQIWPIIKAELQKLEDEAAAERQKHYQAIKTPPQTPKGKKGGK